VEEMQSILTAWQLQATEAQAELLKTSTQFANLSKHHAALEANTKSHLAEITNLKLTIKNQSQHLQTEITTLQQTVKRQHSHLQKATKFKSKSNEDEKIIATLSDQLSQTKNQLEVSERSERAL